MIGPLLIILFIGGALWWLIVNIMNGRQKPSEIEWNEIKEPEVRVPTESGLRIRSVSAFGYQIYSEEEHDEETVFYPSPDYPKIILEKQKENPDINEVVTKQVLSYDMIMKKEK